MRFFTRWLINSLAIFIVANVVKGIEITNLWAVLIAAILVGIINAFLRPLIIFITLPLNILTLGLFTLFINGALFYLVANIVKGFSITGFWSAFWGYILFSIISLFLNMLTIPIIN
ncbi:MAG: phage holin family protein [Candidatus Omnitrophica bacterium]|nr:phage holin family protein [Candidatus Omnitrophota bacterium]